MTRRSRLTSISMGPPPKDGQLVQWRPVYMEARFDCTCGTWTVLSGANRPECWDRLFALGWEQDKGGRPVCPGCAGTEIATDADKWLVSAEQIAEAERKGMKLELALFDDQFRTARLEAAKKLGVDPLFVKLSNEKQTPPRRDGDRFIIDMEYVVDHEALAKFGHLAGTETEGSDV